MSFDAAALGSLLGTLTQGDAAPLVKGLAEMIGVLGSDESSGGGHAERTARRRRAAIRLRRALQRLSERNALLADALGACECWAEDPECTTCGGTGHPGYYQPGQAAFASVVAPLLRSRKDLVREFLDAGEPSTRAAE